MELKKQCERDRVHCLKINLFINNYYCIKDSRVKIGFGCKDILNGVYS